SAWSDHATDEPAIALMKSRRRIAFSKAQDCADYRSREYDYSRDLRPAKWCSGVSLHGSNPVRLVVQKGMSAFAPKSGLSSVYSSAPTATCAGFVRRSSARRLISSS